MILPSGFSVVLTDTVGFIQDLPTTLVAAFRSTLVEVKEADLLLHVVDSSNPDYFQHEQTVQKLLTELNIHQIPQLTVYNKRDILYDEFVPTVKNDAIHISAFHKDDLIKLKIKIEEMMIQQMVKYDVKIPSSEGKLLSQLKSESVVKELVFIEDEEVYQLKGYVFPNQSLYGKIKKFQDGEGEQHVEGLEEW